MQYQRRSIRKARAIRTKAFFITLLFHLALIGYFTYGADLSWQDYLPEAVAEWVGESGKSEGGTTSLEATSAERSGEAEAPRP